MIELNMSDVISVLSSCKNYIIAIVAILVIGIAVLIACSKVKKPLRGLVRANTGIAMILAVVVIVNMICNNTMYTLLTLATSKSGEISEETTNKSLEDCKAIAEEGIVLLKNDGFLPMGGDTNLNVFGWASVNPIYGGSGAGALNDLYDRVTLLEGLEDSGYTLNEELTKLYTDFGGDRGAYGQGWALPEPGKDAYTSELMDNAKAFSDAAVVVIARWGGEGADLPTDATGMEGCADGQHYLQLTPNEKDMLDTVCANFEHVVLVYDGLTTFEMGFLADYPQIQSVLWCAGPGQSGFDALGEILAGTVNPSGKTADTFLYDLTQAPTWNNFGDFHYDNMDEFMVDPNDPYVGGSTPTFVNYTEGIYLGYRFFETAAAEGVINYDEVVQFPFGYGLSYTTFQQTIENMKDNGDGTVSFDVAVTNTGDVAGKDVVQIYVNPPYTDGGIEKASANLIDYEKTEIIDPGKTATVSFTVKAEDLASYDVDGEGCYVLDAGDYIISANADSHNIYESFTYNVAEKVVYGEDNARSTDQQAAVNVFDEARGVGVEYLSRAGHFANLKDALAAPKTLTMPKEDRDNFIWTANYQMEKLDVEMPPVGVDNGLKLEDLRGADFNDERWDALVQELTMDEMQDLIAHGGFQTAAADSIGKVQTIDCDGPSAVSNNFTGAGSVGFTSNIMMACTWNDELALAYGTDMGAMTEEMGCQGWYAPSANLHRSAFGGRDYEYFSEDPLICGNMAAQALLGAQEHGVYGYLKHYAMNEQETNRWSMICEWATEQSMREIYLKPFEIAVKVGNAPAVMSSFNYIGPVWAGGNKITLTTLLKDEWGFEGFILTDYFAGAYNMNADQVIEAGGASCLSTFDIGTNYIQDTTDPTSVTYMQDACHGLLYTVVNSNAYANAISTSGLTGWQKIMYGIDAVIVLLMILWEVMAIRRYKRK